MVYIADICLKNPEMHLIVRPLQVLMLHSGDDTHRMFVAEQVGFVWVYLRDGSRVEQPFLDLSGEVLTTPWLGDERGFLGMAFHPRYRDNGRFFIYYSIMVQGSLEKVRISEMGASAHDMNKADHNSERSAGTPKWGVLASSCSLDEGACFLRFLISFAELFSR